MKSTDLKNISTKYKEIQLQYDKLGVNISQALELLLKENSISYLSINNRTKAIDSFIGKIEKKNYKSPFEEIEDICGIRIICYYQSDVNKIKEIIRKEFEVLEDENKEENLEYDQFGYRSFHFIIRIKKEWLNTPNYRGLENLKAELQIRTVLMHAWAEIEHKLAYKSKSQIPKEFRRKLSRISAKLEESDEQFEEIKNQMDSNKIILIEAAKASDIFEDNIELNLDNLKAFLDYAFPNRHKDIDQTRELFDEMIKLQITLKDLTTGYNNVKNELFNIEKEEAKSFDNIEINEGEVHWQQTGAAMTVLELTNENYYKMRKKAYPEWMSVIDKFRESKLNK